MRTQIPESNAVEALFTQDHTCCVCNERGKPVQIHHIDDNPPNHDQQNLAVLCLDDHDRTQIKGGFGRKLSAAEVRQYRDDWLKRVIERRATHEGREPVAPAREDRAGARGPGLVDGI
jgi:hypothetical protein